MQKLAVVYFPKITSDKINNFRRKYDPVWKIIPPHITIVSPISEVSESQLVKHVETVIKNFTSFSIYLTGLTKTYDDYLFLLVKEGNKEILNLHNKLYSGVIAPYMPTDFPFVPHITLGYFRTKEDNFDNELYVKAYAEAQNLHFDTNCKFDAISVIKGDGLSPARIVKVINLLSSRFKAVP